MPEIETTTRKGGRKGRERKSKDMQAGSEGGTERVSLSRNGFANLTLTEGEYLYMILALFLPVCCGMLSPYF